MAIVIPFDREVDDFLLEDDPLVSSDAVTLPPISIEDAVDQLRDDIESAVDFIQTTYAGEWEEAEDYYNGKSNLLKLAGRSQLTETPVRDAVRSVKVAVMRLFCQAPAVIKYTTDNALLGPTARAQTVHANYTFWANNGYEKLLSVVHDALLKKIGLLKVTWQSTQTPRFVKLFNLSADEYTALQQVPEVTIGEIEERQLGNLTLYDCELTITEESGRFHLAHVPLTRAFWDEDATSIDDCRVIGERNPIPIGDIIDMGIADATYDWDSLDVYDPDTEDFVGVDNATKQRVKVGEIPDNADWTMQKVLLTEVYARFDLVGTGVPQLYRFWLAGSDYEYLDHERVEERVYKRFLIDPVPNDFVGKSLHDVLKESQDGMTSILRAMVDNAHLSNNKRLAVHETMVNMSDVLSTKVGHPIRVRAPGMIQELGIESTIGSMNTLLETMRRQSEIKSGVTSAAMGLDPGALQSTDKEAVRNTIAMAAGQVEFIARNLAETGMKPVATSLLTLSMRNKPRIIEILIDDVPTEFDQAMFRPDLPIMVNVGLGNAPVEFMLTALQETIAYQAQLFKDIGASNPFVSPRQHYNAIADRLRLLGVSDVHRYFNPVDNEQAAAFQKEMEAKIAASQPPPPPDPTQAIIAAEEIRSKTKITEIQAKTVSDQAKMRLQAALGQSEALSNLAIERQKLDIERDKIIQDLYVELAKLGLQVSVEEIKMAMQANNKETQ